MSNTISRVLVEINEFWDQILKAQALGIQNLVPEVIYVDPVPRYSQVCVLLRSAKHRKRPFLGRFDPQIDDNAKMSNRVILQLFRILSDLYANLCSYFGRFRVKNTPKVVF